jgi:hypothetical protein
VRNAGGAAAGRFAVAATFQPGNVYVAAFVEGLAGGQPAQVQLSGTLTGTGIATVAVVADLNNEVAEFNENNNIYNITYRVDYPIAAQQNGLQLSAGATWNLDAGNNDILWDGSNLVMQNGAKAGVLSGVTYENAHYDLVSPAAVNLDSIPGAQMGPGVVIGIITDQGKRAVLRVDNLASGTLWISYRVYNA